jgi:PIN domain nuclease of toxin-antitoxin system
MKILLDTHIFLWYITGDKRLAQSTAQHIQVPENEVFLSVVSFWEIILKHQLGKLPLLQAPEIYIPAQRQRHAISSIDVDEASIKQLVKLPPLHNDPFDRLLICQAIEHNMSIATVDSRVLTYPISTI